MSRAETIRARLRDIAEECDTRGGRVDGRTLSRLAAEEAGLRAELAELLGESAGSHGDQESILAARALARAVAMEQAEAWVAQHLPRREP